jgi:hypothetical protein
MPIDSVVIKQPDEATTLKPLNSMDEAGQSFFQECVVYQQLIEIVAE